MKQLLFVLSLFVCALVATAQGGPWKWAPFPSKVIDYPQQNSGAHREYRWLNGSLRFVYLSWVTVGANYPQFENVSIRLENSTGEALEVTVSIREMGIERTLLLPPYSDQEYPLAHLPDVDIYDTFISSGVHLFMEARQGNYHFKLGGLFWGPGAWNAPGGGFIEHSKNYTYPRPNKG